MNRCDDCVDILFATDSEEEVRSYAYGRPTRDSLRTKERARAQQHSRIVWVKGLFDLCV